MRRTELAWQAFIGILVVALGAVLAVGLMTRAAFTRAFSEYLGALHQPAPGMGMGRRIVIGAAEQTFSASVNRGVVIGAVIAVGIAALAAVAFTRYLTRPLRQLEEAAQSLAEGDLSHRVAISGPAEIRALGDSFNTMADSLEESEDLRRRLVADVAHELRNPIAAARAQAEGMAEGVLVADSARLDSLVEDLEHLTRLVDDLQELASAEAGQLAYDMGPVDLVALAEREVARVAPSLAEGVSIAAIGPEARVVAEGDEGRLSQVLRNLLSNAVRHTIQGSITVTVSVSAGDARVAVSDTGEGIAPEEVERVFERFYRADSARAADTGGAGLGLAISKRIVADHGGRVFASSEPGSGTTVGFELPLAESGGAAEPRRSV